MDFSVLLSLYKKESPSNFISAIEGIINQTILPSEIILMIDGPIGEELDSVVSKYVGNIPYLKVIRLEENIGLGRALNEGLKHCSYDIVARMDTDDIAKPDRFEKQLKVLHDNPDIDVVGSWTDEFIGDTGNVVSQRKLPEFHKDIYKFAKHRNPINHPTVMFRKEAVLAAGGYKHFPLFEDYYLWIRMLKNGAIFHNIQESLLYFRTSIDVYKRRGGFKYAVTELKLRKEMYTMGFISLFDFIVYTLPRFVTRIIPSVFRKYLYKIFLR